MSKLGYTWYSQDYISDPEVMMMTPSQRGIYRDIIDLAYKHSNKIPYTVTQLSRYTNATEEEVKEILDMKAELKEGFWVIPSCQKRIDKAERNRSNGTKGGRPKNPKHNPGNNPGQNPKHNPGKTQNITQSERQIEREIEREKKENIPPIPPISPKGKKRPQNVNEVCEYFKELGLNGISQSEAEKFWDHYTSNGWKVGRNPMKDWRASCRNWKKSIPKEKYEHQDKPKMPWI